jgi:hypothetical protein
MTSVLSPHNVQTTLNYYAPADNQAPYNYTFTPPEGTPRTNIKDDPQSVVVRDVRGSEATVGLDKTGFQFVKHVSEEKAFTDEDAIQTRYYQEVEELLKKETGARKVVIFDHTIRQVP